jgi:hypothetical protein
MSLAKCHKEDTGAASWKAATFSMEETDIVREGGWCEWLRTVSVRRRSTKPLGSITGNRLIVELWLKYVTSVVELGGSWTLSFSWMQTRNILSYIKFYEHFG